MTNRNTGHPTGGAFMRTLCTTLVAALALTTAACDLDLDLTNPNAPTENEALGSVDGLVAVGIGIQEQYASSVEDFVLTSSLITDEWGTKSRSLTSYQSLLTGENFDESYLVVEAPWANAYGIVRTANNLLDNVPAVIQGAGLRAGMTALAKLMKGMALGTIVQQYEEVPIDITVDAPLPQPRDVVLDTVLALLESARSDLSGVADADLAGFRSRVLGTGFDLESTIDAMLARYYLMDGQYQAAIDAAGRVPLDVLSTFDYTSPAVNPIQSLAIQLDYVAPLESFVEQAEPGDQRPGYWVDLAAAPFFGNPPDTAMLPLKKYAEPADPFPVYLPDEMRLIQAEANADLGNLAEARRLINEVRTQTSSAVDEPVAGLPALDATDLPDTDAVLRQIAYERRYELFEQGLRWEDTRRLPDPFNNTVIFEFLPIPAQECQSNPARPCG